MGLNICDFKTKMQYPEKLISYYMNNYQAVF